MWLLEEAIDETVEINISLMSSRTFDVFVYSPAVDAETLTASTSVEQENNVFSLRAREKSMLCRILAYLNWSTELTAVASDTVTTQANANTKEM